MRQINHGDEVAGGAVAAGSPLARRISRFPLDPDKMTVSLPIPGYVRYVIAPIALRCSGVDIPVPLEHTGWLQGIRLEEHGQGESLALTFDVSGLWKSKAIERTRPLAETTMEWLVLKYRRPASILSGPQTDLKERPGAGGPAVSNTVMVPAFTTPTPAVTPDDGTAISGILRPVNAGDQTLVALYHAALSCDERVAQFVLLYSLAESLAGDGQKGVDQMLLRFDPSEKAHVVLRDGGRRNARETRYSQLRNEIAHPRGGTNPRRVRGLRKRAAHLSARFHTVVRSVLTERLLTVDAEES